MGEKASSCRSWWMPLKANLVTSSLGCCLSDIHRSSNTMLLLLLLLSRFSRVRLCATPLTAAHQAPPSLGFIGDLKADSKTPLPKYTSGEAKGKVVIAVGAMCFYLPCCLLF